MILYIPMETRLDNSAKTKLINETGRIVIEKYYGNVNFDTRDILDILYAEITEIQNYSKEYGPNKIIFISNLIDYCFGTMEKENSDVMNFLKYSLNNMDDFDEPVVYLGYKNNIPKDLKHIQYYRMDTNGIDQAIEACVTSSFYKESNEDNNLYLSDTPF